jgi:cytochrome oxidase assembly protein ShyY1
MDSNESTIVMPIVFRFRWMPFIAAMIAVSVGLLLGQWQTRRALEKESIELKLLTRAAAAPIVLDGRAERLDQIEYRQVSLSGEFVRDWPIYLDNRPYKGGAGFYVLMPFKLANSTVHVLIARGWIPRNNTERSKLPTLVTPGGTVEVQGLVRRNPGKSLQLGPDAALLPDAIVQNLDVAAFAAASKLATKPFLVEQLSDTQDGLIRDWPRPSSGAEKHRAYAFQWYALAAMAFLFFVATGFRRGTR